MSTHNIHLIYRTPKRYPTIISIVLPGVALIVTFQGSNYRCLEHIFMVPKGFEPSKFDCICFLSNSLISLPAFVCTKRLSYHFHSLKVLRIICKEAKHQLYYCKQKAYMFDMNYNMYPSDWLNSM